MTYPRALETNMWPCFVSIFSSSWFIQPRMVSCKWHSSIGLNDVQLMASRNPNLIYSGKGHFSNISNTYARCGSVNVRLASWKKLSRISFRSEDVSKGTGMKFASGASVWKKSYRLSKSYYDFDSFDESFRIDELV